MKDDMYKEKNQIEDFRLLSKISENFLDYRSEKNFYQNAVDNFLKISGAKFAAFNLYEKDGMHYTTVAISGNKNLINKAADILGIKINKKKWVHDEVRTEKIKNDIITRFNDLYDLAGSVIPKIVCNMLTKNFSIGQVVLIKITKDEVMLGDFTLFMPKDKLFEKDDILKLYSKQIGLMIERKRSEEQLKETESRFRHVIEVLDVGILVYNAKGLIIDHNEKALKLLNLNANEVINKLTKQIVKKAINEDKTPISIKKLPIDFILSSKKPIMDKLIGVQMNNDKNIIWLKVSGVPVLSKKGKVSEVIISFTNYTEIKNYNDNILSSEEKYRLLTTQMQLGLAHHEIICNSKGVPVDYRFISVNKKFEELIGFNKEEIIGKTVLELLPNTEKYWIETYGKVALTGEPIQFDNYSNELKRYYSASAYCPKKGEFAVIIDDITEKMQKQKQIEYLSYYDQLTGIHNRRYYEQEIVNIDCEKNYPLAVIMADVNGLKLVNDAFGHKTGDLLLQKFANILQYKSTKNSLLARIGGDEFVILLPKTNENQAEQFVVELNNLIENEKIDNIILSASMGFSIKKEISENIDETFMKAEDNMYRQKLSESKSLHSKTVSLIMKTLFERNTKEMHHSERVGKICEKIAEKMGFTTNEINEIKIAGIMHDIGKIGISEVILNKPDKLNEDEWSEIKRHPEIGYRILSSSNEFSQIANYVLEHHERWDGKGYPKGLKGEEILLQARILSVADSYDAMTKDRPYNKALTKEQAILELKNNAGKQFDENIVKIFIEKVLVEDF